MIGKGIFMRFFRRSLTGLFIMALTLGLLALGAQSLRTAFEARSNGGRPAQAPNERVFTANLILAEPAAFTPVLTAFGEIRSRRTLELRAPRAGTVIALGAGVEDGARVTKGQLLLRLDPADATAARDLAATDLSRARAEVDEAGAALLLARDDLAAARIAR
jgi:multidrug efflux pump subunit AcrA (membrane-fusion protein)